VIAHIGELAPSENAAALALARACSTGSDAFSVERGPDFFALARQLGAARYFGAWDERGVLIASVAVTRQERCLADRARDVHYVHDLRVDPAFRGARVASRLLARTAETLAAEVPWCFASVLGENPALALLRTGFVAGFERVRELGRTQHVGLPLFTRPSPTRSEVLAIDRDTFRAYYARWAQPRYLAPGEQHWQRAQGDFFAVAERGELVAVYKLVDERAARRFIARRGPGLLARAFARLYGRRGAAGLPEREQELPVCYAAFYAARDARPELGALANHARDLYGDRIPYMFVGLADQALAATRLPLGSVRFTSQHLGFGAVPDGLRMDFHELTLI
jgi:ribosomal protein S18 acetylase RimI-like enzyme